MKEDNMFHIKYPSLVAEWHPTKNGSLKPEEFHWMSNTKVWWRCIENNKHEWEAVIANRHKSCCPYCSGVKEEHLTQIRIEDLIYKKIGKSVSQTTKLELLKLILDMEEEKERRMRDEAFFEVNSIKDFEAIYQSWWDKKISEEEACRVSGMSSEAFHARIRQLIGV